MYSLSSFFFSAAAVRKCRWGVLLRAVSKHRAGNSLPVLHKCRPAAQIAISYVILPFKNSPAGLQRKMHPPFGYSLPKPKGRCECANFRIAHYFFIFLLNSFSVWICQRLLRVIERRSGSRRNPQERFSGYRTSVPFERLSATRGCTSCGRWSGCSRSELPHPLP